jgi:hypothetical protein
MKKSPQTIALDFDGVLHAYRGWNGGKLNGAVEGALEAVEELIERGFRIVVHSARDAAPIRRWLKEQGFPALEVTREKPPAMAYVDDLAVRFDGQWTGEMIDRIASNRPYWKHQPRRNTLSALGDE